MLRRLGPKRLVFLLLSLGYVGLFVDAYIGHEVSGGGISENTQYLPLVFAPTAAIVCAFLGLQRVSERSLHWTSGIVGWASSVMGLVGTLLHLRPVFVDLQDEETTFSAILGALGSSPPLLAPAAFLAIGVLMLAVGSRRVRISVDPRRATPEGAAGQAPAADRPAVGERTSAHRAA